MARAAGSVSFEMPKFIKPGKVVIVLRGKHAGKKGVIVRNSDAGTKSRKYAHAVIAGVDKAPLRVKRGMSRTKIAKRSRVFPFLKVMNYQHLMPTRCVEFCLMMFCCCCLFVFLFVLCLCDSA